MIRTGFPKQNGSYVRAHGRGQHDDNYRTPETPTKIGDKEQAGKIFGRKLPPEKMSHKQAAIDMFGITDNPRHAFYMLDDGRFLSGLEEGGNPFGYRSLDHGAIGGIYADTFSGGHEYMDQFMDEGNIRMQPETSSLSFRKRPTEAQMSVILDLVRRGKLDTIEYVKNPQWSSDNMYLEDIYAPGQVVGFINEVFGK